MKKVKNRVIIFCLVSAILGTSGVVYAKNSGIVYFYNSKNEIQDSITTKENTIVPFYSLEKVDDTYKVVYSEQTEEELEQASKVSPYVDTSYEKIITKIYTSLSSIPETSYYSEYNNTYQSTFDGTLYLDSVEVSTDIYKKFIVTFKGSIYYSDNIS